MGKSINKVFLVGNVGKDPEVREIDGNVRVTRFPLATSTGGYTTAEGKEVAEQTQWHNVVAWRKLADIVERYVRKGDRLAVVGQIQYSRYEGKDGGATYYTDIVASDIVLDTKDQERGIRKAPADDAPRRDDGWQESQPREVTRNRGNRYDDDLPF